MLSITHGYESIAGMLMVDQLPLALHVGSGSWRLSTASVAIPKLSASNPWTMYGWFGESRWQQLQTFENIV